ncbi:hypothetical protein M0R45_025965 [Rubus argutus]|uniref:Uncharacterized protein n=1 Tax=Rubus argutus TaxID=59490 RepID=A0AAW1WZS8_RUBAR
MSNPWVKCLPWTNDPTVCRVQVEMMLDRPVRLDRSNAFDLVQLVGRCGEPYQSPLSFGSESDAPEYSWTRPTMSIVDL